MVRIGMVIGQYPAAEQKRREEVVLSYATPAVEIEIVRLEVTPYVGLLTPAELQLLAPTYIAGFQKAEKRGCDAVVPFGVLDIGVDGGRSAVDIPVVGACEAVLRVAAMLGDRFGMIAYSAPMLPYLAAIVRQYGMERWIVGWRSIDRSLPEIADDPALLKDRFLAHARALVREHGAEVIIPMGVTQCPVHFSAEELATELGVPVVEGIGAPIRMAAAMAELGLMHSRRRWPKSAAFAATPRRVIGEKAARRPRRRARATKGAKGN